MWARTVSTVFAALLAVSCATGPRAVGPRGGVSPDALESYGSIPARSTREMQTFLTHPWVVATSAGACLEIRVPRAPRYRVTIR